MNMSSKFVVKLGLATMALAISGCNKEKPENDTTEPKPTGVTYNVNGKLGSLTWSQADSSYTFWQKVYGATAADDKVASLKVSASQKAQGTAVIFENALVTQENIDRVQGNSVFFKNFELPTAISAEGKNIGQTVDGVNKIKDARFSSLGRAMFIDNGNVDSMLGVLNNPNTKWKITGNEATGYGSLLIKFGI